VWPMRSAVRCIADLLETVLGDPCLLPAAALTRSDFGLALHTVDPATLLDIQPRRPWSRSAEVHGQRRGASSDVCRWDETKVSHLKSGPTQVPGSSTDPSSWSTVLDSRGIALRAGLEPLLRSAPLCSRSRRPLLLAGDVDRQRAHRQRSGRCRQCRR